MPPRAIRFPSVSLVSALPHLAVLGPGLLGGSLLHDAKRLGWPNVRAWARREETVEQLRAQQLAHLATTDLAAAVQGAQVIVLASPVGSYPALVEELLRCELASQVIITDLGSVKGPVVAGIGRTLTAAGIAFVGGHPMAGSEAKGLAAARPQLFDRAFCLLTPTPDTPPFALATITALWEALGAQVATLEAARHDAIMARISHLPHLAAAAITLAALEGDPNIARYAAGGLRDTTRVASGAPAMWEEILSENRTAVLNAGRELHQKLGELLEFLENRDHAQLRAALEQAKALRDARYPPASS